MRDNTITWGFIALFITFTCFSVITAGHRGVVTSFGAVQEEVLGEGIHLSFPFVRTVHEVNVQIQKTEADGQAASKDLQQVHTKTALNFHLDPAAVADVYQTIGDPDAVGERIIGPSVQEAFKAVTANYTAEELISKRAEVRDNIVSFLAERLSRHGVLIDEFSILNFAFSSSFNEAIEAKTTAEQLKLKAERDLERIKIEGEQKVALARAEAESLKAQRQEITPELLRLRETENQRLAIERWNGVLPTYSGGPTPLLQLSK